MAYEQYKVQPFYDSLVAKLICWADRRDVAIERMKRALNEYVVEGIKTNIPFHKRVLASPQFVGGQVRHPHRRPDPRRGPAAGRARPLAKTGRNPGVCAGWPP